MKKITWVHTFLAVVVLSTIIINCTSGDKKPGTAKVTPADTTRVIDTTIIEDGVAPVGDELAKKPDKEKQKKIKIACSFGQKKFNNRKRPIEEAPGGVRGKPPKKPRPEDPPPPPDEPPPPPPEPPPPTGTNVIYINFFGKTVTGTMWNTGSFTVAHSGLAQPEMDYVLAQVRAHFPEYNVLVTYDEAVFNATPEGHKVEVIVTESWEWFGQSGGVAYINSFFWTDATPAFVFSTLLNYSGHNISEAVAHEAGHTLGLRHQSDCTGGVVTNQYSWGKTMGNSYNIPLGLWVTGTSSLSCMTQNDTQMLTSAVGLK